LDQFKSGFPHNWKELLVAVDEKRRTMSAAAAAAKDNNGLAAKQQQPAAAAKGAKASHSDLNVSMEVSRPVESPADANAERKPHKAAGGGDEKERKVQQQQESKAMDSPHGARVKISHDDSSPSTTAASKDRGGNRRRRAVESEMAEEEEERVGEPISLDGKVIADMTRIELLKGLRARGRKVRKQASTHAFRMENVI
jgi:hypothetical protein